MLGVQTLSALCLLTWGMLSTFIILWGINKITPIRMDPHEELLGADLCEHNIMHGHVSIRGLAFTLNPHKFSIFT